MRSSSRDFDLSDDLGPKKWKFDGSYSSFAADRLKKPKRTGIAVNQLDTMLPSQATMTQIPFNINNRRERIQIAHKPELRAFVTDKITNLPVTPAYEQMLTRNKEHTLVTNHEGNLRVNIQTAVKKESTPCPTLFDDASSARCSRTAPHLLLLAAYAEIAAHVDAPRRCDAA